MAVGYRSYTGVLLSFLFSWSCTTMTPDIKIEGTLTYVRPKTVETDKLIVFVHGVFGDAVSTWTNSRTGAYWPSLFANDTALTQFAVAVAEFYSPMLSEASSIEGIGDTVGQALIDKGIYRDFRQIFFVTHSMGGLIVRRALSKLNRLSLEERVGAVFFISTPSSGATIAHLATWITANPQIENMKPIDLNTFLKALDGDWENTLREIRDTRGRSTPRIYCAYETVPMVAGFVIVPYSAMRTRCDETPAEYERDHSGIVKPESPSERIYQWVQARLLGLNRIIGTVTWEGSETLGEFVEKLRSWYQRNITSEFIKYRSEDDKKFLENIWIPRGTYIAQSWGELFQTLSKYYPCISVSILLQGSEIELSLRAPVKSCPAIGGGNWYTCRELACQR